MSKINEEDKPLKIKEKAVLNNYFLHFNGTRAWMQVHPKSSYDAARSSAAEFLAKPNVKAEIERRMSLVQMSADEALQLNADIARGDIGQVMDVSSVGFNLDMEKAQKLGLTKLIKRVKQKTTTYIAKKESEEDREVTDLEIELYPADAAIERVLKVHGRLTQKIDLTSGGEKIDGVIRIVVHDDSKDANGT